MVLLIIDVFWLLYPTARRKKKTRKKKKRREWGLCSRAERAGTLE